MWNRYSANRSRVSENNVCHGASLHFHDRGFGRTGCRRGPPTEDVLWRRHPPIRWQCSSHPPLESPGRTKSTNFATRLRLVISSLTLLPGHGIKSSRFLLNVLAAALGASRLYFVFLQGKNQFEGFMETLSFSFGAERRRRKTPLHTFKNSIARSSKRQVSKEVRPHRQSPRSGTETLPFVLRCNTNVSRR
jgi:hypothetical protein